MTRRAALAAALALAACASQGAAATVAAFCDARVRGREVVAEGYVSADLRRSGYDLVPGGPVRLARYTIQRVDARGAEATARVRWVEAYEGQEVTAFVETLALRRVGSQWLVTRIGAGGREPLVPPNVSVVLVRAPARSSGGQATIEPAAAVANRSPVPLRGVEVSVVVVRRFAGGIQELVRRSTVRLDDLPPFATRTVHVRPVAVAPGSYEIVVQVTPVRGETETDDNRATLDVTVR